MMEIGKVAGYKKDIAAAMPEIDWGAAAADVGDADLIAQIKMVTPISPVVVMVTLTPISPVIGVIG